MSHQFLVSTTGVIPEVIIDDLGARLFIHPVVDKDLAKEYTITELMESLDLQDALNNNYLVAKDENGNPITDLEDWFGTVIGGGGTGAPAYGSIHLFDDKGCSDYTTSTNWCVRGYGLLNMDLLKDADLIFRLRAKMCLCYGGSGDGDARIWSSTAGELAKIDIGNTSTQWLSGQLSSLPSSGLVPIEFQVRAPYNGRTYYYWAFIEVGAAAPAS